MKKPAAARPATPIGRVAKHMLAALIVLMPAWPAVANAAERARPPPAAQPSRIAEGSAEWVLSPGARQLADWVALTGDHAGAPFVIVDKKRARVFVFEANARLRAHSAVLLGAALGDGSVPGIGTRAMEQILPEERTTPAGRFVAERGRNTQGEDVVWVDYEAAVSMHRVRTGTEVERRAQRLASATIDDNRISYGCINVPVAFYEAFIQPIFALRKAIVYVLPDIKSAEQVFGRSQAAAMAFNANRAMAGHVPAGNGMSVSSLARRR